MYFVAKPNEEAKAFIQAAGLTDETQCKAVGTLVIDLKNYGLWDKMKAIYPFVGQTGISSSFQYNLKDPSTFRGIFNGGITYASTGVTGNGTTGYMNTTIIPSTNLLLNSVHISAYVRNNTATGGAIGCSDNSLNNGLYMNPRFTNDFHYTRTNSNSGGGQINTEAAGFWVASRISPTSFKVFKSNTTFVTETILSSGLSTNQIYVLALNLANVGIEYSNREIALASIGDGLTDIEAANFYTAVQRFQTTLGRQV
jgi:hypothetical protein